MFSTRTPEDFAENAISLRVREMRGSGIRLLDLTESNPTRVGFLAPPELLGLLANPEGAHYSPNPRGLRSAREAVSRDYASRRLCLRPRRTSNPRRGCAKAAIARGLNSCNVHSLWTFSLAPLAKGG